MRGRCLADRLRSHDPERSVRTLDRPCALDLDERRSERAHRLAVELGERSVQLAPRDRVAPRPHEPVQLGGGPREVEPGGPVSSSASMRWNVMPISSSPFRIVHATGTGPRCRGRSEGWPLSQPSVGTASASSTGSPCMQRGPVARRPEAVRARSGVTASARRGPPAARRACRRGRSFRIAHSGRERSGARRARGRPRAAQC